MTLHSRRSWIKKNLGLATAGATLLGLPHQAHATKHGKLQLSMHLSLRNPERLKICKQLGVTHAITGAPFRNISRDQYVAAAKKMKEDFAVAGFKIAGIEGHPVSFEKIKLGLDGRDEEIKNTNTAIEALSKVGIDMICYNFMAGLGWYRTTHEKPERGGAMTSEFSQDDANKQGLTEWGEVSEDKMWDNITYFLERVIPVAEKFNVKMALHPDDPPISPLRGIARICTSAANYRRIMNIAPSPVNGITFCQANFRAMGENIYEIAREFCEKGKVFFVHFRDIEGYASRFHETFHDNGPTDMAKMLEIYSRAGFVGPIRPDHAPTLEGESKESKGYGMSGKIFAFGYMIGLMDAMNISYE
ncbi:MAG: mannonate dehydratase [Cyclobacteriaceae bacterium]|nr:mannonate dehydratase [Cyclobacteriaceae bacterium]